MLQEDPEAMMIVRTIKRNVLSQKGDEDTNGVRESQNYFPSISDGLSSNIQKPQSNTHFTLSCI
jgi:hypothetical protein